jgi:D-arabinose 1-dehydrogenase-like Zn-dependent alcohol dehydrogenase
MGNGETFDGTALREMQCCLRRTSNDFVFIARSSKEDLTIMRELMATGKVTPVIDKCYRLSEVPKAIQYLEEGHARGKVVITLE